MKKQNFILVLACMLALLSCSKDKETNPIPQNVEFTLSYSFIESGSMSRSGATVYEEFYNSYIATKKLTPDIYSLTFMQGDEEVATINGRWDSSDMIKLPEGTYNVVGTCGEDCYYSDIANLCFNQEIEITKNTTNINLDAMYDCFLVIFDKANITAASYYTRSDPSMSVSGEYTPLYPIDDIYYIFLPANVTDGKIAYNREDMALSSIYISTLKPQQGYYYYLNDITSSFNTSAMVEGN